MSESGPQKEPPGRGADVVWSIIGTLIAGVLAWGGIGWLLDRWLGTTPWFMIGLTLFCVIGKSVLLLATYNEKMKRHEAERAERIRGASR